MKKYKLIKQYPGSIELGAIMNDCGNPILQKYFTNYPEFWQEVVDPEFEIITFNYKGELYKKNEQGYATETSFTHSLESHLEDGVSEIHSVKRISDGEIFTVGDRAKTITSKGSHTVTQLRIRQKCTGRDGKDGYNYDGIDRIWIDWEEGCGGNWLESTEKLKQPIFLTHDGEDIFEGDIVHWVKKDSLAYDSFQVMPGIKFCSDLNAYFLTREAAQDYIKKNKILFTTEDGVGIKQGDIYHFVDTDFSIHTMHAHQGAGQYSERKYFSTVEQAHEYVVQNVKALSIKDFWEITCMSTSNFNKSTYMRDLVKKALGIK
jgi:hypothetical protein